MFWFFLLLEQGVTRLFFETCQNLDLPVFAVEPSLLRALRAGENSLELWNRGQYPVLTFGVIEASQDELVRGERFCLGNFFNNWRQTYV